MLAGGLSRRFGSPKTLAVLAGEPMILRPLRALTEELGSAAVVCKPDTALPSLPDGTEVWHDSSEARHPLAGIVTALERSRGEQVAVLACDMPGASSALVRRLVAAASPNAVAATDAGLEPLAAVYSPEALPALREALERSLPMREAVAALRPALVQVDAAEVRNVNEPGAAQRPLDHE